MSPLDLTPNIFLDGMQVWGYFSDMLVKANSYHPSEEKAINGRCPYLLFVLVLSVVCLYAVVCFTLPTAHCLYCLLLLSVLRPSVSCRHLLLSVIRPSGFKSFSLSIKISCFFTRNLLIILKRDLNSGVWKMAKEFTVIIEQDEEGYFDRQRDYFSSEEGRICSGKAEG